MTTTSEAPVVDAAAHSPADPAADVWLDQRQQQLWRAWLKATTLLPDTLSRELEEAHGLTGSDYEVMVHLSEAPGRRLRMSELADRTLVSRSRLTHQVDRMEKAGWVSRERCAEDRRGSWAVLTDTGWELLVLAAPTHVAGVRRHLVDLLGDEHFTNLGVACGLVADHLTACQSIHGERRHIEDL